MKTSPCTDGARIALFPGSFDPFTRGHESVVRRALPLFDRIVIAIGVNIDKPGYMPKAARQQLIEGVFADEPRISVITYTGLTVDAARQCGAQFILRGVRSQQDYENEMHMADVNRDLSGIETVLLYSLPEYSHVSSTVVRELARFGHDIAPFLPQNADLTLLPR